MQVAKDSLARAIVARETGAWSKFAALAQDEQDAVMAEYTFLKSNGVSRSDAAHVPPHSDYRSMRMAEIKASAEAFNRSMNYRGNRT